MKALLLIALVSLGMGQAHAQESSTSTLRAQDVQPAPQDTVGDIDKEITNAKMRATLGSKSRWSVKSTLTYNGGTVERPGSEVRPDYQYDTDPSRSTPKLSSLGALVGVKYSLSARSGLTLGTGVLVNNPFQGDVSRSSFEDPRAKYKGRTINRAEVSDPYLDYTYAVSGGGLQWVSEATYTAYTSDALKNKMGGFGDVTLQELAMKELGRWTLGLAAIVVVPQWETASVGGFEQYEWEAALSPFAEYAFNDRYSFRTVFNWADVVHYPGMALGQEPAGVPAQSVGLGIAATRDLYFYPNVQFVPWDIRPERTNVALQANVNLF